MVWRMEQDERGSQPPAESGKDKTPQERRGEDPGQDPVESPGPLGNPESDEEALSHRQQEGKEPELTRARMSVRPVSEGALRAILLVAGLYKLALGLLALVAPGTFFDEIGRYGVENLHYVGDVGAFQLAAGVGLLVALRASVVAGPDPHRRRRLVCGARDQPRLRHRRGPQQTPVASSTLLALALGAAGSSTWRG